MPHHLRTLTIALGLALLASACASPRPVLVTRYSVPQGEPELSATNLSSPPTYAVNLDSSCKLLRKHEGALRQHATCEALDRALKSAANKAGWRLGADAEADLSFELTIEPFQGEAMRWQALVEPHKDAKLGALYGPGALSDELLDRCALYFPNPFKMKREPAEQAVFVTVLSKEGDEIARITPAPVYGIETLVAGAVFTSESEDDAFVCDRSYEVKPGSPHALSNDALIDATSESEWARYFGEAREDYFGEMLKSLEGASGTPAP